jgi:phosphatidylethanolamine/phosphatidyl-N-methylethanolamine N-methyltransferase
MGIERNKAQELISFWREWLRDPRVIGAVLPSGWALGKAISDEVNRETPGKVIEIGAGTGSITRHLLTSRAEFSDFVIIESSDRLAHLLQKTYHDVTVTTCCASQITKLDIQANQPVTVVSSLPFKSLPGIKAKEIISSISRFALSTPRFRLIQYAYFGVQPFPAPPSFKWSKGPMVFANFPPARVWVLSPTLQ